MGIAMSLSNQDACDFVVSRLSDTLGPRRLQFADVASGAMTIALAMAIATVGSYQAVGIARQVMPLDGYEWFAESVGEHGRAGMHDLSLAESVGPGVQRR
jgi:hypothetical protein